MGNNNKLLITNKIIKKQSDTTNLKHFNKITIIMLNKPKSINKKNFNKSKNKIYLFKKKSLVLNLSKGKNKTIILR